MAYDPHYGSTTLLLHLDGADGSTAIVDSSASPKTVTAHGGAVITTAEGRFGGSCLSLGGADYLLAQDDGGLALGAGDFTIEMLVKTTRTHGFLIEPATAINSVGGWWALAFYYGRLAWSDYENVNNLVEGVIPVNDGLWHHIAVTRRARTVRTFVDGAPDGEADYWVGDEANYAAPADLCFGVTRAGLPASHNFVGHLDEVRITKGVARYTSGFTPPNEPFASSEPPPTIGAYAAAPTPLGAVQALVSVPITQVWVAAPSPLARVKRGTDAAFAPKSLPAPRFGTPMVLAGLQPSDTTLPAKSLTAGKFGVASFASTLQTGPVQSLQSTRFGALAMRVALAASSLSPAQFGTPSVAIHACASPLRPVRFGTAGTRHSLAAASLCSTRFGAPALHLDSLALAAQSLRPVQFGAPSIGSMAMCARTMRPVRFGQPALDRGAIC